MNSHFLKPVLELIVESGGSGYSVLQYLPKWVGGTIDRGFDPDAGSSWLNPIVDGVDVAGRLHSG